MPVNVYLMSLYLMSLDAVSRGSCIAIGVYITYSISYALFLTCLTSISMSF